MGFLSAEPGSDDRSKRTGRTKKRGGIVHSSARRRFGTAAIWRPSDQLFSRVDAGRWRTRRRTSPSGAREEQADAVRGPVGTTVARGLRTIGCDVTNVVVCRAMCRRHARAPDVTRSATPPERRLYDDRPHRSRRPPPFTDRIPSDQHPASVHEDYFSVHHRPKVSVKRLLTARTILHGSRVDRRLRFRRKSRSLFSLFGNDAPTDAIVPGWWPPTASPYKLVIP